MLNTSELTLVPHTLTLSLHFLLISRNTFNSALVTQAPCVCWLGYSKEKLVSFGRAECKGVGSGWGVGDNKSALAMHTRGCHSTAFLTLSK